VWSRGLILWRTGKTHAGGEDEYYRGQMRVEAREQAKYKEVMEGFMLDHWQNTKTVWEVRLGPA